MVKSATPVFPIHIKNGYARLANADGTGYKTIYTPGSEGSIIKQISFINTQTTTRVLQLAVTVSGVDYQIGTINVPASAGNLITIPTVNVLRDAQLPNMFVDNSGNPIIMLNSDEVLKAKVTVAVASGATNFIDIFVQGMDF
jgi:hypothetical protein